jgi:predicted nucleic acid-binding Zn ribbon protein
MPTYDYKCENGHKTAITVTYAQYDNIGDMICLQCGQPMKRIYHVVPVNWNGLPPHEADARPSVIQNFIDDEALIDWSEDSSNASATAIGATINYDEELIITAFYSYHRHLKHHKQYSK